MIRRRLIQSILAGIALPAVPYVFAAPRRVSDARVWQDAEKFRLVFDTTGPTAYNTFTLQSPERIVIDLANAELTPPLDRPPLAGPVDRTIRIGWSSICIPVQVSLSIRRQRRSFSRKRSLRRTARVKGATSSSW